MNFLNHLVEILINPKLLIKKIIVILLVFLQLVDFFVVLDGFFVRFSYLFIQGEALGEGFCIPLVLDLRDNKILADHYFLYSFNIYIEFSV